METRQQTSLSLLPSTGAAELHVLYPSLKENTIQKTEPKALPQEVLAQKGTDCHVHFGSLEKQPMRS